MRKLHSRRLLFYLSAVYASATKLEDLLSSVWAGLTSIGRNGTWTALVKWLDYLSVDSVDATNLEHSFELEEFEGGRGSAFVAPVWRHMKPF